MISSGRAVIGHGGSRAVFQQKVLAFDSMQNSMLVTLASRKPLCRRQAEPEPEPEPAPTERAVWCADSPSLANYAVHPAQASSSSARFCRSTRHLLRVIGSLHHPPSSHRHVSDARHSLLLCLRSLRVVARTSDHHRPPRLARHTHPPILESTFQRPALPPRSTHLQPVDTAPAYRVAIVPYPVTTAATACTPMSALFPAVYAPSPSYLPSIFQAI